MQKLAGLFLVTAAAIALAWWWLGRPVVPAAAAVDPGRIQCMSYAPYRGAQSPLFPSAPVEAAQIEEDLAGLARVTGCVRTYAADADFDKVPGIARRFGLKVLQGLWLSSERPRNRREIDAAVALANRYPDVVNGIVVGNEVLLRGELAAADIAAAVREVKAAVKVPVTYADVWEFWFRNRDLADAVDFITIHILPYWEDIPIPADRAADHVEQIRSLAARNFPGKDILIGEVGWPSAGRMREGALPSPSNQALVLEGVMAWAHRNNYRVNLIEAFDQPWKRALEGTVGGYWGLFGSRLREPKFAWGMPVSDHPWWSWQLGFGIAMAGLVFLAAVAAGTRAARPLPHARTSVLAGVAFFALVAGIAVPWTLANVAIESLGPGGWMNGAAFAAVAIASPIVAGMALAGDALIPTFAQLFGRRAERLHSANRRHFSISATGGMVLAVATVLAIQAALGLVFDPRYRDFSFAPLTAAFASFLTLSLIRTRAAGARARAETIAAITLLGAAAYIVLNEGFANWQALWFSSTLAGLAIALDRQRDAQST